MIQSRKPRFQRARRASISIGGIAATLISLPALSQSSVTLFGVVDASIRHVSVGGSGSKLSMASGGNSTSRWGLRGHEDLGGGMHAGFHLESGFQADTGVVGSNGLFFDRRSTLSLGGKSWGELRLGRDQVPTHTLWLNLDPFAFVGVAGAGNLQSSTAANPGPIRSAFGTTPAGLNSLSRISNAVQYILPAGLGGFEGRLLYAFREDGIATGGYHRVMAAQVGYRSGPLALAGAVSTTHNSITPTENLKDVALSAQYDFGWAKLGAGVRRFSHTSSRQTNTMLAAVVPVKTGQIKLSWVRANLSGNVGPSDVNKNDATQWGIGYVHALSKRTALYATLSRIDNRGTAAFVTPGGPDASPGRASRGYEAGLRHTF